MRNRIAVVATPKQWAAFSMNKQSMSDNTQYLHITIDESGRNLLYCLEISDFLILDLPFHDAINSGFRELIETRVRL